MVPKLGLHSGVRGTERSSVHLAGVWSLCCRQAGRHWMCLLPVPSPSPHLAEESLAGLAPGVLPDLTRCPNLHCCVNSAPLRGSSRAGGSLAPLPGRRDAGILTLLFRHLWGSASTLPAPTPHWGPVPSPRLCLQSGPCAPRAPRPHAAFLGPYQTRRDRGPFSLFHAQNSVFSASSPSQKASAPHCEVTEKLGPPISQKDSLTRKGRGQPLDLGVPQPPKW